MIPDIQIYKLIDHYRERVAYYDSLVSSHGVSSVLSDYYAELSRQYRQIIDDLQRLLDAFGSSTPPSQR